MKSVHKRNEQCFGPGFEYFEDNADPDPGWEHITVPQDPKTALFIFE